MMKYLKYFTAIVLVCAVACSPMAVSAITWINSTENPMYEYECFDDGSIGIRVVGTQRLEKDVYYIPSTLDGYTVSMLHTAAFQMSEINVGAMVVPGTIKSLEPYSLDTPIEQLYLSEGLETISYLTSCYSPGPLKEVVIPTTVTFIDIKAFGWRAAPSVNGSVGGLVQTDEFTVYSDGNEVAREYAEKEGYTYIDLSDYERGDMDLSGATDMMDVLTVYQMAAGTVFGSPVHHVMGECTGDADINMLDAIRLYGKAAGCP